jgi:predicted permease
MRPEGFVAGPEGFPRTQWDVVGPRYFSTLGTPLLAGRDFNERDDAASAFVVAINETMAQLFFGEANVTGRHLVWDVGGVQRRFEVVAVARDVKQAGAREEPPPRFYLPYLQLPAVRPNWTPESTRFLVRTVGDPTAVISTLRGVVRSDDPRLSVISVDIALQLVHRTFVRERMVAILLVAFSALAVGLACLGLYGLMAYHVVQRTSEIGIRMALGAQRTDVLWATVRGSLTWIAAGIVIGVPLASGASRVAQGLLFGLSANDPGTFIAATIVMTTVGLLAAFIPAWRASRIDPLVALRAE